jgi:hypothetical protein
VDEKSLHKIILQNKEIQADIVELSGFNQNSGFEFISEFRLQNNMIVDFAVKSGKELIMLIELKGSNIGTNDFVRGIGQLHQYINLPKSKDNFSGFVVSENFKAVLIIPNSVFTNKILASDFHFPLGGLVYEINEKNYALRKIDHSIADNLLAGNRNIKTGTNATAHCSHSHRRGENLCESHIHIQTAGRADEPKQRGYIHTDRHPY